MIDITQNAIPSLEEIATKIDAPIAEGPPDLIPGLVPLRGMVVIAGETNIGKSSAALEICSSVITGQPLWRASSLTPTKIAKKVVYILGEHDSEVIQRLWGKLDVPMDGKAFIIGPDKLGFDKYLVASGRPNIQAVNKLKRWTEGADLVVFDPLGSFVVGADSENDNSQMRQAIELMTSITHEAGASTVILAHQGKPYIDKNGQEHARRAYAIRGASAIEDASTNIYYMSRISTLPGQMANAAEAKNCIEMYRRKYKGEAPECMRLRKDPDTLRHTLLDEDRPMVEARRQAVQAIYGQFQLAFPEASLTELVQMVAIAAKETSTRTIWRHLRGNDAVGAGLVAPLELEIG